MNYSRMAAEPGFEPGLRDPKSPVLPLHNSALYPETATFATTSFVFPQLGAEGRIRTDTRVAPQQFLRLPRLPFRHFGKNSNVTATEFYHSHLGCCNTAL